MKIVNIIGGLGNQMFQYAFAIALKHKYPNEEVRIDTSHFHYLFINRTKGYSLHNGYEIDKVFPHAYLKKASAWQLIKLTWYMPNYVLSRLVRRHFPRRITEYVQDRKDIFSFQPEALNVTGNCYFEGNWESAKYFTDCRDEVQKVFTHGDPNSVNARYIEKMEEGNSVAIHVRRGDYMSGTKWSGICTLDYYQKAVDKILSDGKKHEFYVFSNDLSWCKENIEPMLKGHEAITVTENKGVNSCWDMFLMSHCKDLIIANSSFSWWGAFLNHRNGKVVAPSTWLNEDRKVEIWLDDWIRI